MAFAYVDGDLGEDHDNDDRGDLATMAQDEDSEDGDAGMMEHMAALHRVDLEDPWELEEGTDTVAVHEGGHEGGDSNRGEDQVGSVGVDMCVGVELREGDTDGAGAAEDDKSRIVAGELGDEFLFFVGGTVIRDALEC